MEPIVPIYDANESGVVSSKAKGTLADLLSCCLMGLSSLIALGYSVLFFTRFLENDTHLWGVISAFVLCFGLGALAYVPAAIVSRLAWQAYKTGPDSRGYIWAFILSLPWAIFSGVLVFVSGLPKIYSLPLLIVSIIFILWALISLKLKPRG